MKQTTANTHSMKKTTANTHSMKQTTLNTHSRCSSDMGQDWAKGGQRGKDGVKIAMGYRGGSLLGRKLAKFGSGLQIWVGIGKGLSKTTKVGQEWDIYEWGAKDWQD